MYVAIDDPGGFPVETHFLTESMEIEWFLDFGLNLNPKSRFESGMNKLTFARVEIYFWILLTQYAQRYLLIDLEGRVQRRELMVKIEFATS
jgi:hypothetical protein